MPLGIFAGALATLFVAAAEYRQPKPIRIRIRR
jgi:hypothetical protein